MPKYLKEKWYVKYTDDAIWNRNLEKGFDVYNTQEFRKKSDYKYFIKHYCDNQEYTGANLGQYGKIKYVKFWCIISTNCVHDEFWSYDKKYIPERKFRNFWLHSKKRKQKYLDKKRKKINKREEKR